MVVCGVMDGACGVWWVWRPTDQLDDSNGGRFAKEGGQGESSVIIALASLTTTSLLFPIEPQK